MRVGVAALVVLALAPAAAAAQRSVLDTVETRLGRGDYAGARAALERWWGAAPDGDEGEQRTQQARALLLRARLAGDLETAESDYLAVVLGYPSSSYAATALLRLGQGLLAADSPERAVDYLDRFRRDFPDDRRRDVALLWLARARRAVGDAHAAAAAEDPAPPAEQAAAEATEAAEAAEEVEAPPAASGRFAVQTGAFRYERGAEALAARLRRAGYRPRLVYVPGSTLLRVRLGRFRTAAAAASLARRLRAAGFAIAVVRNAHRERAR